jgi:hypothetical protein
MRLTWSLVVWRAEAIYVPRLLFGSILFFLSIVALCMKEGLFCKTLGIDGTTLIVDFLDKVFA